MTPALVFKEGPLAGQRVEVDTEVVVGREDAGLTIEDDQISRRHAVIRPGDGRSRDRGPRLEERDVRERGPDRVRDPARRRRHGQAGPERAAGRIGSRGRHRRVRSAGDRYATGRGCASAGRASGRSGVRRPALGTGGRVRHLRRADGRQAQARNREPAARAPAPLLRGRRRHRRGTSPLLRRPLMRRNASDPIAPTRCSLKISAGRSTITAKATSTKIPIGAPFAFPFVWTSSSGKSPAALPGRRARAPTRERSPAPTRRRRAPARPDGSSLPRARRPATAARS